MTQSGLIVPSMQSIKTMEEDLYNLKYEKVENGSFEPPLPSDCAERDYMSMSLRVEDGTTEYPLCEIEGVNPVFYEGVAVAYGMSPDDERVMTTWEQWQTFLEGEVKIINELMLKIEQGHLYEKRG